MKERVEQLEHILLHMPRQPSTRLAAIHLSNGRKRRFGRLGLILPLLVHITTFIQSLLLLALELCE